MGWRQWFGGTAHTTDDLIAEAEAARPSPRPATPATPEGRIADLVRQGKKIDAIKLYRETYGTGLKEAKDAIDAIASGKPQPSPPTATPPASDALVLQYIDEGKLIQAIKEYRVLHNTGLAEAKDAVDAIVAQRASGEKPR